MSRIHPPASGSPSGVVPKQTSRVRTIQSGVAGPAGQSASAHQDAVMTRIAASAATAIRPRVASLIRSSRGTTGSSS